MLGNLMVYKILFVCKLCVEFLKMTIAQKVSEADEF